MSLQVLACGACGGQVPLGEGDSTRCPFCGAEVMIPAEHRALREAERRDAAARTEARALYARLTEPPSLGLRIAGVVFHPWFLVLDGLFILLLVAMLGLLLLGNAVSPWVHANLWDVIPDKPKGFGTFFICAASVLVGISLGVHGRRRLFSGRSLRAALAAQPPVSEGGPARCRSCGAPLSISAGEKGARCAYCRADNLIDVPRAWLEGVSADVARVGHEIDQASGWWREETARLRKTLRRQLLAAGGVFLVFITLVAALSSPPDWRSSWSEYVEAPRPMLRLLGSGHRDEFSLAPTCQGESLKLAEDCAQGRCRVWLYAALREGERLSLRSEALANAQVRAVMHSHFWWGKDLSEGFGTEVANAPLAQLAFTAPWSAWYQLRLDFPQPADPPSLCAVLEEVR